MKFLILALFIPALLGAQSFEAKSARLHAVAELIEIKDFPEHPSPTRQFSARVYIRNIGEDDITIPTRLPDSNTPQITINNDATQCFISYFFAPRVHNGEVVLVSPTLYAPITLHHGEVSELPAFELKVSSTPTTVPITIEIIFEVTLGQRNGWHFETVTISGTIPKETKAIQGLP